MSTNLKGRKNCKAVVDNAVKAMGRVDILVNNATYQMMVNDIKDLSVSEYVSSPASLISPFSTIRYKLVNVFQASPPHNNYKSTANPPICRGQWVHPRFQMAKYTHPHLSRGSAIINNASINAYIGRPDLLDYPSTKGAIISFTRGLSN